MAHKLPTRGQRVATHKRTAKPNIDVTGGLPQGVRTRAKQDYSMATRRKSKANPGNRKMRY